MSRPSSVSVPVLSKHTQSIDPETLIERGAIQKMFFFSSRFCAYIRPTDMAAKMIYFLIIYLKKGLLILPGRAGGTAIVIKSKLSTTILSAPTPR